MDTLEPDLSGIRSLARMHLDIRNRSWMKRIHRDSFIGSDFVDFLVNQGLADSRTQATDFGKKMIAAKFVRGLTSSSFRDAYQYYRFAEDDDASSAILASTDAGNGNTSGFLGLGGCKWSIAPHTAHNSYILDISLAEELERAVSGASVEARARAVNKLRDRVREQGLPDAPNWNLISTNTTTAVAVGNGKSAKQSNAVSVVTNVYERTRPRGDFSNIKMTTSITDHTSQSFVASIIDLEKRKEWETMFEDGVVVETIDIGEGCNKIFGDAKGGNEEEDPASMVNPALPEQAAVTSLARKTDDVMTFLQTVELAGIPDGVPIAFLNDPERQHALAHLRKQMMMSNPEDCMLCGSIFTSQRDIRFCPNCAMVTCAPCVGKRVFEVASRQLVSVCVHCYRSSSRIRHPPTAVKSNKGIKDEAIIGKWWRPEELGMVDLSLPSNTGCSVPAETDGAVYEIEGASSMNAFDTSIDNDVVAPGGVPLIPGLLDNDFTADMELTADENTAPAKPTRTARCKQCGEMISRDFNEIDAHMEICTGVMGSNNVPVDAGVKNRKQSVAVGAYESYANSKTFAGISRKPADVVNKCASRILYRTARSKQSKIYSPREVCVFQDSFMDGDTCYVYEVSVRHSEVRGIPSYVNADVMLLLHIARPGKAKNVVDVTVISQIDHHASKGATEWLLSRFTNSEGAGISNSSASGVSRREELVRELKSSGKLHNILKPNAGEPDDSSTEEQGEGVCLNDFELLAVLGRGGFGKVMQVKHITTGIVYAMKILKKSELKRRRQVERTQTERTILANVRHPFIVCLYYAFQNEQKLYMVMDFVQGGDFFTLMRKFKRLPEEWVKIYIAEIAMALQHLHDMDVVYRDLKPENILLCRDGHLKLTDFGLSRFFEGRPPAPEDIIGDDEAITRSFCGTEQYMSPEMLLQQGHNWRMDWWCVGLLMHEMISARHPFHGPSHYDTLRNMVTKQPLIDQRKVCLSS